MLSYQHAYHAGCLADVQKHAALSVLLDTLTRQEAPIAYFETHAGRGLYDLASTAARKTGEAAEGIGRIMAEKRFPKTHPYIRALLQVKEKQGKTAYPGSPMLAWRLLRRIDRLLLAELHPQEFSVLEKAMRLPGVQICKADGFTEVLNRVPQPGWQGVVLIDPSYEVKAEYEAAARFVLSLHRKWPQAVVMLWYPLLADARHEGMVRMLEEAKLPGYWQQEVRFEATRQRAVGSGLIIANLPEEPWADLDAIPGFLA